MEGTADGSFTIGEYDEDYEDVQSAPRLDQFPLGSGRWSTLLDGVIVNGVSLPLKSTIKNVPEGKIVTLFDTGTATGVLPTAIVDGIYSHMPGAVKYEDGNTWIVPCDATATLQFVFA